MAASMGVKKFCAKHVQFARFFATQVAQPRCIKPGDPLPNVTVYEGNPNNTVQTHNLFQGKKGVIFSVPGAFTPGCSRTHVPEYLSHCEKYRSEGYEEVVCVSVNDPFVMEAWGQYMGTGDKIRMISDMKCEFTKAINMELDCIALLGNIRSRRYFLLIEDNTVQHVSREPHDSGLSCLLCIKRMKPEDVQSAAEGFSKEKMVSS